MSNAVSDFCVYQAVARLKSAITQRCNAVGYGYSLKADTIIKRPTAYACNIISDSYIFKTVADGKSVFTDSYNAVRYFYAFKTFAPIKRIVADIRNTFRYG